MVPAQVAFGFEVAPRSLQRRACNYGIGRQPNPEESAAAAHRPEALQPVGSSSCYYKYYSRLSNCDESKRETTGARLHARKRIVDRRLVLQYSEFSGG
jgi:hypothetical protein